MNWFTVEEKLPPTGEEVLIKVGSSFYLAEFMKDDRVFLIKAGGFVPIESVHWAIIVPPNPEK